jgi:hypothetical protein
MAGRHSKRSRPVAAVAAVVAPAGLAAAAMAVSSMTGGVAADPTSAAKPPSAVDLLALITPANSTAQIFAGTTYYGVNYADSSYGPQTVVPFLAGPNGIATAISDANDGPLPTSDRTVVLASGWGAGQTGTALGELAQNDPGALSDIDLVILDNNTNRAGGGFWTTYAPFAPLLLTSADPTPSGTGVPTLDVAYEYNINSDAPVDPLNPFALGNSLAAYAYGYGAESSSLNITQDPDTKVLTYKAPDGKETILEPGTHYVVDSDGNITPVATDLQGTDGKKVTTTYITVDSGELPLTRPLRLLPGGDILADTIDPTMTQLVNAGYNDGKGTEDNPAIPLDPTVTRPMQPGSSLTGLGGVPGSVPAGLDAGATTATKDVTNPTNFVSKPLDEAGKLPVISGLSPSTLTNSTVSPNTLKPNSPNFFAPVIPGTGNNTRSTGSATTGSNVAGNFTDQVKKAVDKVTGGLTAAKPAASAPAASNASN